ncbi:MAG: NADH-quinone oxidoreductase subunit N, partial [Verrucomicrobiota bacterium]
MTAFLLSPEFRVVILGIVLLMLDSFTNTNKRHIAWTAIVGLTVLLGLSFFPGLPGAAFPRGFYLTDPTAIFFKRFMLLSTILAIALALDYAQVYQEFIPAGRPGAGLGEFFILPVFACAGLMWLVSAADFIMIFVSLELVTMCFYVLVASMRKNLHSLEAGVKYLILGALSTGFLVYGITWITGLTGRTSLDGIRDVLPIVPQGYQVALMFGLGLVLVALGFKVAAVPFQFWVPDVYQGAPTPVTAYLSVASKAAGFVVLMRVVEPFLIVPGLEHKIISVLTILAALTLIYGNLAALPQINLKRLLSYSSIAHAGYLLVGVASVGADASGPAVG